MNPRRLDEHCYPDRLFDQAAPAGEEPDAALVETIETETRKHYTGLKTTIQRST